LSKRRVDLDNNILLKIEGLSKKFGENTVLKDINMDIKKDVIFTI